MKFLLTCFFALAIVTTKGQMPPCLLNNVNPNGFGFGVAYPANCEFIASWMDDFLPCHGSMNRRPGFFHLQVISDTTYTIQLGTDGNPSDLVWTIWNACPFSGGSVVASVECGGWDCISYGEVGFEAVISLPAGNYWMWSGMFSDGVVCTEGVVNGSMTIGGVCDLPPPPVFAPCPTYTIVSGNETVTYCGEQTGVEMDIPGFPCGQFDMYVTVQFTTDGSPYPIEVISDANYTDFPNTPINHQGIFILDGCNGNLVASTYGLACAYGPYCGELMDQEYLAQFCLPAGTYVAYVGYMNATDLPFGAYYGQEGCISYTFGQPTFLNMDGSNVDSSNVDSSNVDSSNVDSSNVDSSGYVPPSVLNMRRRWVHIEGKGFFIFDPTTGEYRDALGRVIGL